MANGIYIDPEIRQEQINKLSGSLNVSSEEAAALFDARVAQGYDEPEPVEVPEIKAPEIEPPKPVAPPPIERPEAPRITSGYGEMSEKRTRPHQGIDIAMPIGQPIPSLSSGTITKIVKEDDGDAGGLRIYVRDDAGIETRYMHASRFPEDIEVGTQVEEGQPIMFSGNTGRTTGPHLHLETGKIESDGKFVRTDPGKVYPRYFGVRPGPRETPEHLQPDFKLEIPTLLTGLEFARREVTAGRDKESSIPQEIERHARRVGIDVKRLREAARAQGISLGYMVDEVGRKGRPAEEVIQEAKDRGVYAFLDPEQRAARKKRGALGIEKAVSEFRETGDHTVLLDEFGDDVYNPGEAMPFLGGQAVDFADVAKPDEQMYRAASLIADAIMNDDEASKVVDAFSEHYNGAKKYADNRTQQYLKKNNLTPASEGYAEMERKFRDRAVREIVALKTVGMWTGPIIMPEEEILESAADKDLSDRFFDALKPTVEVVGIRKVGKKTELVVREENPLLYFFNLIDMAASAGVGALSTEGDLLEGAVEGMEARRNPFEAAIDSEFAEKNAATKTIAFIGGGLVTILTPDLLVGAGGVAKLSSKLLDAVTTNRAAKRGSQLLADLSVARSAEDYEKASELEATLRREFKEAGGLADLLDILDMEAAQLLAKNNPEMLDGEFVQKLSVIDASIASDSSIGPRALALHPSFRKPRLTATKGEGGAMGVGYGGEGGGLYETQDILDELNAAKNEILASGTGGKLTQLQTITKKNIQKLERLVDAADDPEGAQFIARLKDSLADAIDDPKAWRHRFHGDGNLESELAQITALRGPTQERIASAVGDELRKLEAEAKLATGRRKKIHKLLVKIGTKAKNVEDPLVIVDRAIETVRANNEARGIAAKLLSETLSGSRKLKPVTGDPRIALPKGAVELSGEANVLANKLGDAYDVTDEQARALASIMDARARAWGTANGKPARDYFNQNISKIVKGEDVKKPLFEMNEVEGGLVEITTKEIKDADGFGLMFRVQDDVLSVKTVELPPNLRGQGIGAALYGRALQHAKSLGKGFASDVSPSPDAINVYEKLIKRGAPIRRRQVDLPDGTSTRQYIASADDLAKANLKGLETITLKASEAVAEQATKTEQVLGIRNLDRVGFESKIKELKTGKAVARFLASDAESAADRMIAFRIIPHLDDVTVTVANRGDRAPIRLARGLATGTSRISTETKGASVFLRGAEFDLNGINAETVLHELLHAATQRRIKDGLLIANQGTELSKAVVELNDLTRVVIKEWKAADYPVVPGSLNMDELLAWGLSNKEFQDWLQTIKVGEQTAFNKFVQVIADLLGIPRGETNALSEVLRLTDDILSAPIEDLPKTKFLGKGDDVASDIAAAEMAATRMMPPAVEIASDGRAVLNAFVQPTLTGAIRGMAHVFRRDIDPDDVKVIEEWCGVKNGRWTEIAEEKWARGFESYLAEGIVPNDAVQTVFDKFKVWITEAYRGVIGSPVDEQIPDNIRRVMDRLLTEQPPAEPPFKRTLEAMSLGSTSQIIESDIDPLMELAKAARSQGLRNSEPKLILSSLEQNGAVVFTKPVEINGVRKKMWTEEDIAELQLNLESKARVTKQMEDAPEIILRDVPKAEATEAIDERILAAVGGEDTLRKTARVAVYTVLGGDNVGVVMRRLRPEHRHSAEAASRSAEQAIGDAITHVSETGSKDGMERLYQFLGGVKTKFRTGRDALSSGEDFIGLSMLTMENTILALAKVKTTVKGPDGKKKTLLDFLGDMAEATDGPEGFKKGYEAFMSVGSNKQAMSKVFDALVGKDNQMFDDLIESFYQGRKMRPEEAQYLKLMMEATGLHIGRITDLKGAERAQAMFEGIEDIYGREGALRASVLLAAHGQAARSRTIWSGLGLAIDQDTMKAWRSWLNGEKIDPDMIQKMHEMVRNYGMRPEFVDDAVMEAGFYIPKASREKLTNVLAKAKVAEDPEKMTSLQEVGSFVKFIYTYMKTRMTRGGFFVRQRYFLMNTIDHFNQMAMVSGYRPALASTVRVATQNVMVLHGMAHTLGLIDKVGGAQTAENLRKVLQSIGDEASNAVGRMLNVSKYRIEVNPILEGVASDGSRAFRLVDPKTGQARFYNYDDIRKIAVEEGIFASFDTRELQRSIKTGMRVEADAFFKNTDGIGSAAGRRVKETLGFFTDNVAKTAECWSERERIGAMVTLMEVGMEPRQAARLVIDGLFDYAGSMSKFDRHMLISSLFPFWAFQKNANRLILRQLATPAGAYRMGVLRRSYTTSAEAITELLYERVADPYGLDAERMPPELQDKYYFLRNMIENGYGPLEDLKNHPEGSVIIKTIEEDYGPIESIDPEKRKILEQGYGGYANTPRDIRDALRLCFAGNADGFVEELESKGEAGQMVSLAGKLRERLHQIQPMTEAGETFSDFYNAKPGESARRNFHRDRVGIGIKAAMTEDTRKFLRMVRNDPVTGFNDVYLDILYPDSTIYAGFRHAAAAIALPIIGLRAMFVDEDKAVQTAMIRSALDMMGDPLDSPLPNLIASAFTERDSRPRRLNVELAKNLRGLKNKGVPLPTITIIDAVKDEFAPEGEQVIEQERAYMSGGAGSMLFSLTPLGELNDIMARLEKAPIQERMGIQGELLQWAEVVLGLQVTETSRQVSAKADAPKFGMITSTPPIPK